MLAIKNNLMAENAARHLGRSYDVLAKSVERLSSGLRINSAKDDAAGMAVRELIRADIAQLQQGSRNAQDAISMLQTSEGAMGIMDELLIRMKELAEQAATGSYSQAQRDIMNEEFVQLSNELTRIAETTEFNDIRLLDPAAASAVYKIHIASDTTIDITAKQMDASALGVKVTGGTKEQQVVNHGVANASDTYLTKDDIKSADASANMKYLSFRFDGADSYTTVNFGQWDETGATLNQVVNAVNSQWQTDGNSGYVAFAHFDSDSQQYKLKLENPTAEAGTFEISGSSGIAVFDATDDFTQLAIGSGGSSLTLSTTSGATSALAKLTSAITAKDEFRASLGYMMNRLEGAVDVLDIQAENLLASESRISDVDVATEMAAMTRNQVLSQAGISMLAQANAMPQMALSLLQ